MKMENMIRVKKNGLWVVLAWEVHLLATGEDRGDWRGVTHRQIM